MLKIKLVRKGKKNSPTYRICIQEAKQKLGGKVVETIGYIVPKEHKKHEMALDKEKYKYWVNKGATPTTAVLQLVEGKYKYKKYVSD